MMPLAQESNAGDFTRFRDVSLGQHEQEVIEPFRGLTKIVEIVVVNLDDGSGAHFFLSVKVR